ncbi:MAG: recombinase family protein [Alphaproteobacteria bacterium]
MTKTSFRCAVYTRKSHEEGLDQEFNSLDAQLEACRSYIASQSGLAWSYKETRYDDGGISGGHMNRPALQNLIADVKAGLVDIIVVYKVDRLTRSLADFAKLVDVFDEHDVSFVSVTQAFNTTTSMGRLTLNVLLSFAQFEREVTAERIRDKIKASKQRGMWMGGTVPLGYYAQDRKLYICPEEALVIQTLFELYAKHKNVTRVVEQAAKLGLLTRARTSKDGIPVDGKAFTRGQIYYILGNPTYIGKTRHKKIIYDGNHDAIIEAGLWQEVQATLKKNKAGHSRIKNSKSGTLLSGLIFDEQDRPLKPHYTVKSGRRYHYYISSSNGSSSDVPSSKWRLPADMIENTIWTIVKQAIQNPRTLTFPDHLQPSLMIEAVEALSAYQPQIATLRIDSDKTAVRTLIEVLVKKATLHPDKIIVDLHLSSLLKNHTEEAEDFKLTYSKEIIIKRRGHELKIALGSETPKPVNPSPALIKLVSQGYRLRNALDTGAISSIKGYAVKVDLDPADAKRLLPLGYLAPDIVKAILSGQQPVDLTAQRLKDGYRLPITWNEQREYLGFSA